MLNLILMKNKKLKLFLVILLICHLVQGQPYSYKGSEFISVTFQTSQDLINKLVPEPLKTNTDGLICIDIGIQKFESGFSYYEMTLYIPVEFKGKKGVYAVLLYLSDVTAITVGREIWGFPKHYADISFQKDAKHVTAQIYKDEKLIIEADLNLGKTIENYEISGKEIVHN